MVHGTVEICPGRAGWPAQLAGSGGDPASGRAQLCYCAPVACHAMRGVALGFVWFRIRARVCSAVRPARVRLDSRYQRLRPRSSSRNLRPTIQFAGARAERPSAAHDHPQIWRKQTEPAYTIIGIFARRSFCAASSAPPNAAFWPGFARGKKRVKRSASDSPTRPVPQQGTVGARLQASPVKLAVLSPQISARTP
jgi:hypothetical protein